MNPFRPVMKTFEMRMKTFGMIVEWERCKSFEIVSRKQR
jgi:hypothetical protein